MLGWQRDRGTKQMPRLPTTYQAREQKRQRLLQLAKFVNDILVEYQMNALQFAKLSGIPKSSVYTILSADHEPTAANMRKLSVALSDLTGKRISRDYLESLIDEQELGTTEATANSEETEVRGTVQLMPSGQSPDAVAVGNEDATQF